MEPFRVRWQWVEGVVGWGGLADFQLEGDMQTRCVHRSTLFCTGSVRICMYNNRAIDEEVGQLSPQ